MPRHHPFDQRDCLVRDAHLHPTPVFRMRLPADQPIPFQPIEQARDVGPGYGQSLGHDGGLQRPVRVVVQHHQNSKASLRQAVIAELVRHLIGDQRRGTAQSLGDLDGVNLHHRVSISNSGEARVACQGAMSDHGGILLHLHHHFPGRMPAQAQDPHQAEPRCAYRPGAFIPSEGSRGRAVCRLFQRREASHPVKVIASAAISPPVIRNIMSNPTKRASGWLNTGDKN